jgi:hypothetical protein
MRLPRVRFTIKRMMFGMVVLALIMGGCRRAWLSSRYRDAAKNCATLELWCRSAQRFSQGNATSQDELVLLLLGPLGEDKVARAAAARGFQQTTAHYAALRRKYQEAAAWPWPAGDTGPTGRLPYDGD